MNSFSLTFFAFVLLAAAFAAPAGQYSSKYDHINVDAILSNDRVLTAFIKCFLDKGPCTAEASDIKKILPEALETSCAKCSDPQKRLIRKATKYIIQNRKADWEDIRKKFDPQGIHSEKFRKFLAEQ